jgi:hypothetical protein
MTFRYQMNPEQSADTQREAVQLEHTSRTLVLGPPVWR